MTAERLLGEHVERRSGELAGLEALDKRVEVDQLAAGTVHDPRALAHLLNRRAVDEVDGFIGPGQMERDEVGARVELSGIFDALGAKLPEAVGGDELVVGNDLHVESL